MTTKHLLLESKSTPTINLMSSEQLKAFLEKAKSDKSTIEKLSKAEDAETVISIARELGFNISAEEIQKSRSEISESELEAVSGGRIEFDGRVFGACVVVSHMVMN
ncbi:Nif11-like leader peptide family natural product precursor [Synechococcus sp. RS9916]|uniref:Nif11-like leader peptide family natural product precursor n=1 Tax=Synechococcus sp. RS9916 TaxID=221359 RepID=UPI0000E53DC4|nr:Nif11-like leader peptide family natural product precursor [Synechococcus sp. RS9916]EAU73060.1 possible SAP domain [Synechococcus sp. RS9916]